MDQQTRPTQPVPDEPLYQHVQPSYGAAPRMPPDGVAGRAGGNRRAGMALIIVGVLWLALMLGGRGMRAMTDGARPALEQNYAARAITMDVGAADVEILRGSEQGIQIEAIQRGGPWNKADVQVANDNGTLHVSNTQSGWLPWLGEARLRYVVSVPDDGQVQVNTTSGNITVHDIDSGAEGATITLQSVSGDIEAERVAKNIAITTASGSTKLQDIAGIVKVSSASGDVQVENSLIQGVTVATTSGDIELRGASQAVDLHSVSGDISVEDAAPTQLRLNTTSGDIEYNGDLAPSANAVNGGSGDVTLRLPTASGFHVQASTINGELSLDEAFEAQTQTATNTTLDARVGNGAAPLNIQTLSGDIEITEQ